MGKGAYRKASVQTSGDERERLIRERNLEAITMARTAQLVSRNATAFLASRGITAGVPWVSCSIKQGSRPIHNTLAKHGIDPDKPRQMREHQTHRWQRRRNQSGNEVSLSELIHIKRQGVIERGRG